MYERQYETQRYEDRIDAGRQLAGLLTRFRDHDPVVLALPRGGVIVAGEVAEALHAPLDVIVARKLGAPMQPELGIGAIAPGDVKVLDERTIQYLGIRQEELDSVIAAEAEEMERREQLYRNGRPPTPIEGRTVILIDDGLATGVTARAAIRSLKQGNPRWLVLAVPVCAQSTAQMMRSEADEVICALTPIDFWAVGAWYRNFDQTTDDEVIQTVERHRVTRGERDQAYASQ